MAEAAIDVQFQHPSLRLDPELCRRVLRHVAQSEGASIRELTVVLSDHDTVYYLNRRYLDHDYFTDVLAFNYGEEEGVVEGEIYVDLDTAEERHAEFEFGFTHEAVRYAVHGLLHLIGYADEIPSKKREMRALEDRYLREAGVPLED